MFKIITLEKGEIKSPLQKFVSEKQMETLLKLFDAKPGDLMVIVADKFEVACESLGKIRLRTGDKMGLCDPLTFAFCWVTNFPLFEWSKEHSCLTSSHHPFTHPQENDVNILETDPLKVRAKAYDIACNGCEIGGGSIRIHNSKLQSKIFKVLGISDKDAESRFGHMLNAFQYGAPPHGGIAWGLDRLVMLICGEENIREVIAFPKDQKARDLMLNAPSTLPEEQVKEMHIKTVAKK